MILLTNVNKNITKFLKKNIKKFARLQYAISENKATVSLFFIPIFML